MNFLNSEFGSDYMQSRNTTKINKLDPQISFDKDKLPTKLINNNIKNNLIESNTVINDKENKNIDLNKENIMKTKNDFPINENFDFNNLFGNINGEKRINDKHLIVNRNNTSSISEVLFNKPAPFNFNRSKNLSKSCTKFELENLKSKLNQNNEKEFKNKSNTDLIHANNHIIRGEKSFDAYSNCDIEHRTFNRKLTINGELGEIEKEAYGFTNEINRNFKGEMKFNLNEIDIFLENENKNNNGRNFGENFLQQNTNNRANIDDEAIDKELRLIKKISADLRRIDTLSTSEVQDKEVPFIFTEDNLNREINKIKSQVIIFNFFDKFH